MTWVHVAPALLLAAALLTLPGLAVGAALGLRREAWLGAAPLLSVAALGFAVPVSMATHLRWGIAPLLLATALLALGGGAVWLLAGRLRPGLLRRDTEATDRSWWGDVLVMLGSTALAGAWIGSVAIHTIGDVGSVQQSFDGVLHVNAIQRVADLGSDNPGLVAATADTAGHAGFYPPLFHGIGALLVTHAGVSAVVAANVVAVVAAAVAWPLSVALLAHVVMPRHRYGVLATMVGASAIPLFPYLLMSFGVLWPNLLSLTVLPAVLALVVVVLGQARTRSIPWLSALVAGLLSAVGIYYAHPGGVFAAIAMALPVLLTAVVRVLARVWRTTRLGPLWAVLGAVVLWLVVHVVWSQVLSLPQLKSTMSFNWPATMNMSQALGQALGLQTADSPASWVPALLLALGAVHAARQPHQRWLVVTHVLTVYLYMLAAGTDEQISQQLTGFWYNDQFRVAAMLPITGAPLIGIGLVWCRDRALDAFSTWYHERPGREHRRLRTPPAHSVAWQWGTGLAVVLVVVGMLPGRLALDDVVTTLKVGYWPTQADRVLVDHDEAELYRTALRRGSGDDARVIGNPWNGASLAGPLADRESVLGHMVTVRDADRELLVRRFRQLGTDPAVCAAVRRLRVGYATEDTRLFWLDDQLKRPWQYPGLDHLSGVKGLTPVAHEGTVTVYRVTGCGAIS